MILKSLTLKNFRTYRQETFSFHDKFNLIYGYNAAGKTNLLEAVHILFKTKPFRLTRNKELIRNGEQSCGIKGEVESSGGLDEIHVHITDANKTIKLNGKVVYKAATILGKFHTVSFLPSDLVLVKGTPQERRRYIDALICSVEPEHIRSLRTYFRILSQRNAVLSKSPGLKERDMDIWNERIAQHGAAVIRKRLHYIMMLKPHVERIYRESSGTESKIEIFYESSFNYDSEQKIEEGFQDELISRFKLDRARKHTTTGPQRDKIEFSLNSRDAALYASQGEAKNLALALRTAEIEITKQVTGKTPILLLDDVSSELDMKRKKFLFDLLRDFTGQIFVTATHTDEILYDGEMKIFHINDGKASTKLSAS